MIKSEANESIKLDQFFTQKFRKQSSNIVESIIEPNLPGVAEVEAEDKNST